MLTIEFVFVLFICVFVYLYFCLFVFLFCLLLLTLQQGEPGSVAFDQAIVIIKLAILAEKPNFLKTCSNKCLIFSSAKHNYILTSITKQRKFEKIKN